MHKHHDPHFETVKLSKLSGQKIFPTLQYSLSKDTFKNQKEYRNVTQNQPKYTSWISTIKNAKQLTNDQGNLRLRSPSQMCSVFSTTLKQKLQSSSLTQQDVMITQQNTLYGSFYNYRQMFQVSDDNNYRTQAISNILLRNTQTILEQTQLINDQLQAAQMTSKALLNNFKFRLKTLLHQKNVQRNQTIKQRDPRCYNLKQSSMAKINFRMKLNPDTLKQKLDVMVQNLHTLLEPQSHYPQHETEQTVLVTLTMLRDEFKYLCQDYNDFYTNKQQNTDPDFYYNFLKGIVKEAKQKPLAKNNTSLFEDFVKDRWNTDVEIQEQELVQAEETEKIIEILPEEVIEIILIPIPIPPPLPQTQQTPKIVHKQTPKVSNNPSTKSSAKKPKQRQPRDSIASFTGLEKGSKKNITRKKRNTQLDISEVSSQNSRRQPGSIDLSNTGPNFSPNRSPKKNQIQEVNSSDSNSQSQLTVKKQTHTRTQSSVNIVLKKKQVTRFSHQLQLIEQQNIIQLVGQINQSSPIVQIQANRNTPTIKNRPVPVPVKEEIIEQTVPVLQLQILESIDFKEEKSSRTPVVVDKYSQIVKTNAESPIKPNISKPIIIKKNQMIEKKILPFKYQDKETIENIAKEQTILQVAKQVKLIKRLSFVKQPNYKPDLFDIIIECKDVFELNLNIYRMQEINIRDNINAWMNDMDTIMEGTDILKVQI